MTERKNRNREYQQLRVWQDAITLYVETCRLFKPPAFESLERKRDSDAWAETLIVSESNAVYTSENTEHC
jgi:hypothetical protein